MNKLFLLFLFLLVPLSFSHAQSGKRSVSFDWEPIQGAKSYEVQIRKVKKDSESKDFIFKSTEPVFNGSLKPGQYTMKLRSIDPRGVPGPWSTESDFLVPLESVRLTSPSPKAEINAQNAKEREVEFTWKQVPGATAYQFELTSADGKIDVHETLTQTEFKKAIPVGTNFTWKVKAQGEQGAESEAFSVAEASILGSKLEKPKIEKPETEFVREIKWSRPENAENFDYAISKYNPKTKKWEKMKGVESDATESTNFDEQWPGGKYKFSIRAKADHRPSSDVSSILFNVRGGDRSPAAEYVSTVRQSIDRISGWYGIASYLITQMDYSLTYKGFQSVPFKAIGGTGRVGIGWMSKESPWGFLNILDLSGFLKDGSAKTFASMETSAVYRKTVGERDELRIQTGLYYKETPQVLPVVSTLSNDGSNASTYVKNMAVVGPHVGAEYWYSMTPKLGLQVNAHFYYSMMKLSTPSGEPHQGQLSTQYGFLGSYRMSKKMTGLAGVSYRVDSSSYTDTNHTDIDANTSIDQSAVTITDTTTSKLSGLYFNIFAEYSF
jgi:hypothetical protein